MFKSETNKIEPLNSPFSRAYLCPQTENIINCTMGLTYPIDVQSLKNAFSNSILVKHPRFSSLMVKSPNGQDQWKRTQVNIDHHFIVVNYPSSTTDCLDNHKEEVEEEEEALVNAYVADLTVSTPLDPNKPLWEVHVLVGLKCIILRVHHAIGDGVSLMSMLSTCFGQKREKIDNCIDVKKNNPSVPIYSSFIGENKRIKRERIKRDEGSTHAKSKWKEGKIWVLGVIMKLWFTIVFGLRLTWRLWWVKDEISMLSGGDGVELWPRKLVTTMFNIQDFKSIKMPVPNATVNDVLLGIVSTGLSKYINAKTPKAMQIKQSIEVTAILIVNLRKKGCSLIKNSTPSCEFSSWGNKIGLVLQPIYCCNGLSSLDQVRTMKTIMDQKKQSYEAQITYWTVKLFTLFFSPKVASWCCHRMLCNTTLLISNIIGPSEEIVIANNPVSYMKVNISSLPQSMTIHMVSYAGKAGIHLMVAKDIITDPEFLAKCFQDSFLEMKNSIKGDL